ncbi:hypothetical protein B0T16DRAFT_420055, partial [Cercophora newfieldiana]
MGGPPRHGEHGGQRNLVIVAIYPGRSNLAGSALTGAVAQPGGRLRAYSGGVGARGVGSCPGGPDIV